MSQAKNIYNLNKAEEIITEAQTKLANLARKTHSPVIKDYAKFMTRDMRQASQIHKARLKLRK